jgi:hypothetical protein
MKQLFSQPQWFFIPTIFTVQAIVCTVLAWGGSNLPLVTLAVTCAFLAVYSGFIVSVWRDSLDGWGVANERLEAVMAWGIATNQILQDSLNDLAEYDGEAAVIHTGRASNANFDYIATFRVG